MLDDLPPPFLGKEFRNKGHVLKHVPQESTAREESMIVVTSIFLQ